MIKQANAYDLLKSYFEGYDPSIMVSRKNQELDSETSFHIRFTTVASSDPAKDVKKISTFVKRLPGFSEHSHDLLRIKDQLTWWIVLKVERGKLAEFNQELAKFVQEQFDKKFYKTLEKELCTTT